MTSRNPANLVLTTASDGSDKAKHRTQAVYCMNNGKQLQLGWLMFAGDNNEKFNSGRQRLGGQQLSGRPAGLDGHLGQYQYHQLCE